MKNEGLRLSAERITMQFGEKCVLDGVTVSAAPGEVVGLIGPNGAGKSTLIDIISGFRRPTSGDVYFDRKILNGNNPEAIAKLGVARTFQITRVVNGLTSIEFVMLAFRDYPTLSVLRGILSQERAVERRRFEEASLLLQLVGLSGSAEKPTNELSYGQKKLLALAACGVIREGLVLLDEPVAGVSTALAKTSKAFIERLKRDGNTVLLVEHDLRFVVELCDRALFLNQGSVLLDGDPKEVINDPLVIDAYIGERST